MTTTSRLTMSAIATANRPDEVSRRLRGRSGRRRRRSFGKRSDPKRDRRGEKRHCLRLVRTEWKNPVGVRCARAVLTFLQILSTTPLLRKGRDHRDLIEAAVSNDFGKELREGTRVNTALPGCPTMEPATKTAVERGSRRFWLYGPALGGAPPNIALLDHSERLGQVG